MRCSRCDAENPQGAITCFNCGALLTQGFAPPPGMPPTTEYASPKRKTPWLLIILIFVCGACLLGGGLLAAVLFPVFSQAKKHAQSAHALANLKQVDLATIIYTFDHKNKLPDLAQPIALGEVLRPYLRSSFFVRAAAGYQWNQALSGARYDGIVDAGSTWLLHSSAPDPAGLYEVGFVDGHCKQATKGDLDAILARPTKLDKDDSGSKKPAHS